MKKQERNSIGEYCGYCKNEIFDDENFIVIKGQHYHLFCWKQSKTYVDPFDDTTPED